LLIINNLVYNKLVSNIEPELPKVELATKDWVQKEISQMESRVEKAINNQIRWMIGLAVAIIAAVLAVLFQA